jgi:GNAT superfamily N-acetyltransferase
VRRAPERSLPASLTPAELEAAYRFFDNPAVTPDALLAPHRDATRARLQAAGACLVLHDGTSFAFAPHGRRQGLGRLMIAGQGFFAHLSLAVRADGSRAPPGVLALHTWVRDGTAAEGDEQRCWGEAVERLAAGIGDRAPLRSSLF